MVRPVLAGCVSIVGGCREWTGAVLGMAGTGGGPGADRWTRPTSLLPGMVLAGLPEDLWATGRSWSLQLDVVHD